MATITEEQNSMRLAQSRRRMRPYGEIPPQDFTAPEEKTETDAMEKRRLMQAEFAQQQQAAMLEWQMTEEKRQQLASLQLAQARRTQTQDAETKDGSKDKDKAEQQEKIAPVVWGMLFAAAGLFSLIGYLADLLVPFIALVINYCVVFLIWLWAKSHKLKPPNIGSLTKGATGSAIESAAPEAGAALEVANAAEKIPGSEWLYFVGGGVTPVYYLFALWNNNR
ncbi:MAG: hypothetical protein A3C12_00585 [Candidatus Sungbacteria bacterium RIFCSPHIGHO2_02_FULL_49_20]|uniref:Uncharacterized protein n=1 Tax=Candidatus Sungbacteria bacterium RIFCSPHIGHO2_02_FULL_49_20 TaxID=1802272 RepID=A0A1G2KN53_9BACT|nr:MAG: hypothetical protein A3C12_00585 [Candidatus Sungbacteria bacterium RIFCSPHIGHO2_02_FULL_49_20]